MQQILLLPVLLDWSQLFPVLGASRPRFVGFGSHVDVATAGFLKMFDFPIAVGDDVRLLGCWSQATDGTPVFLVHELVKKKVTLFVLGPTLVVPLAHAMAH